MKTVEFFANSHDRAPSLYRPGKMVNVAFRCTAEDAEIVDAALPESVRDWVYYPRELVQVLAEAGLDYRIHCHSGQVLTSNGATP